MQHILPQDINKCNKSGGEYDISWSISLCFTLECQIHFLDHLWRQLPKERAMIVFKNHVWDNVMSIFIEILNGITCH